MSFQNPRKVVSHYCYLLSDSIGNGCSSSVYKAINSKTKQAVSIKVVPKVHHKHQGQLQMAYTQINSLQILKNCPNVLALIDTVQTKNSVYLITQLCQKGTLSELIRKQRKFQEKKAVAYLQQIINGYRSIHAHNLIHRDIKPSNIFVHLDDSLLIGDFGFVLNAKESEAVLPENIGSPLYMPYESLAENKYSFKSDVWAIGVTFLEMLIGKNPWKSKTQKDLLVQLQSFKPEQFLPNRFTERTHTFLKRALQKQVDQRMTPQELFSYSFASLQQAEVHTLDNLKSHIKLNILLLPHTDKLELPKGNSPNSLETSIRQKIDKAEQLTQEHSSSQSSKQNKTFKENKPTVMNSAFTLDKANKEATHKKVDHSFAQLKKPQTSKEHTRSKSRQVKPGQTEKQLLLQVQSQINYFRFLFKLSKKMHETLKTKDSNIKELKEHLLFIVHQRIEEIKNLQHSSLPTNAIASFRQSQQHHNILQVLHQYRIRYGREEEKLQLTPSKGSAPLPTLLTYTLKVLYQNIIKIEEEDELNRKKALIFILQDLLHLTHLNQLHQKGNWQLFHEHSGISGILERKNDVQDIKLYWSTTKGRLKQLIEK